MANEKQVIVVKNGMVRIKKTCQILSMILPGAWEDWMSQGPPAGRAPPQDDMNRMMS